MSTPPTTRPALVCRLIRIRAALTSSSAASVRRHCTTCGGCRQQFAQAEQWESGLRREARAFVAKPPGTLESRILSAVERSKRPERRSRRSLSWGMAGLMATAVVAVVMVRIQRPAADEAPSQTASIDDVIAVASELPRQWRAVVQPGAAKLLDENPLQAEMASVSSDARSALSFLALNFLPAQGEIVPVSKPRSGPRHSS